MSIRTRFQNGVLLRPTVWLCVACVWWPGGKQRRAGVGKPRWHTAFAHGMRKKPVKHVAYSRRCVPRRFRKVAANAAPDAAGFPSLSLPAIHSEPYVVSPGPTTPNTQPISWKDNLSQNCHAAFNRVLDSFDQQEKRGAAILAQQTKFLHDISRDAAQLKSVAFPLSGATGVEQWVKDAHLENDLAGTHMWWNPSSVQWETPYETRITTSTSHSKHVCR